VERRFNVNKSALLFLVTTTAVTLSLSGCSNKTYGYEISGVIEAGQLDYDCPDDPSMDPVGFAAASNKPQKGPSSNPRPIVGATSAAIPTTRATPAAPAASPSVNPSRKTVKLPKKPGKPKRVPAVPVAKHLTVPKGCEVDYELFVRNSDGLFEQDVRQVDYNRCLDAENKDFPACAEG
jgi:hypothetical protein